MGHDHDHGIRDAARDHRGPLAVVLAISGAILVAEVVGAVLSGSLALLADAGHMLTDVAGLSLALVAATLALRPATPERTWGYKRAEVLAAAAQAGLLLAVGLVILVEGVRRLVAPPEVQSGLMFFFALAALLGNGISVAVLARISTGTPRTPAAANPPAETRTPAFLHRWSHSSVARDPHRVMSGPRLVPMSRASILFGSLAATGSRAM